MNIKKALILTRKAIPVDDDCDGYVTIVGEELYWFDKGTDEKTFKVSIQAIMNTEWLPYVEDEKIRPENAGEVWINSSDMPMITGKENDEIWCYFSDGAKCTLAKNHCVVHGNGEWTRIHPPVKEIVEDEEVSEVDKCQLSKLTGKDFKDYHEEAYPENEFPFYVKITGCSGEHFWYKNNIGTYYKVIGRELTESTDKQYKIDDGVSLIRLDDCVIVELQEKCRIPH